MNIGEFKAFIEGVDVADGDVPTAQQWSRIVEKIADIHEPSPVLPSTFFRDVDTYVPPFTTCIGVS